jgi:hypothetical protein
MNPFLILLGGAAQIFPPLAIGMVSVWALFSTPHGNLGYQENKGLTFRALAIGTLIGAPVAALLGAGWASLVAPAIALIVASLHGHEASGRGPEAEALQRRVTEGKARLDEFHRKQAEWSARK